MEKGAVAVIHPRGAPCSPREDENKDMVVAVLAKIEELQKEPEGARITEEEPSCAIVEAARTRGALKNALYGGIDFSVMKDFSEPGGGGSWIGDAHMEPSKKVMARSAPLRNFKCKVSISSCPCP